MLFNVEKLWNSSLWGVVSFLPGVTQYESSATDIDWTYQTYQIPLRHRCVCRLNPGGGVLDFGLDGGVPPGPQDPNPCLEVKKYPCLGILLKKWTHV